MTWTACDNFGKAGTGRSIEGKDGFIPDIDTGEYPWRCRQEDFDICRFHRPKSYFREAIWKNNTAPRIFTTHPKHNGDSFSGTGWHWYYKDYLKLTEKYRAYQSKNNKNTADDTDALSKADTEVKKVLSKKYQKKYAGKAVKEAKK